MADFTKEQITNYMKTLDTGTADGKVVMNQLNKAIKMNEDADIPFNQSISELVQKAIRSSSEKKTFGGRVKKKTVSKYARGGKAYTNSPRNVKV
tara:strand:+ start:883 stop:1164 length:282 start_codon:yes stop_codon:yes gene_type:complete